MTASGDDYWRPAFELMLEESRRSLDRQADRLQSVRERAIGLVGMGALVAAALGLSQMDKPLEVAGGVGIAAFVAVSGIALWILYPRVFRFELSARRMDAWFDLPENEGVEHMIRSAALAHDDDHAYNYEKLAQMQASIAWAVLALAVETVALVVRLMV